MDELSLLLDGIEVKLKKLLMQNTGLKDKILLLEREKHELQEHTQSQKALIEQLEQKIAHLQTAKVIDSEDSVQAKQKVNELLREIETCYELLNSQEK
jgi:sugar-specific transcriptional regulator TrmB